MEPVTIVGLFDGSTHSGGEFKMIGIECRSIQSDDGFIKDERYRMVTNLSKLQCLPKLYVAPVISRQPASEPDTRESREAGIDKERHHGY